MCLQFLGMSQRFRLKFIFSGTWSRRVFYSADAKILQTDVTIMFGFRTLATVPAYVCCNKRVIQNSSSYSLAFRNLNTQKNIIIVIIIITIHFSM